MKLKALLTRGISATDAAAAAAKTDRPAGERTGLESTTDVVPAGSSAVTTSGPTPSPPIQEMLLATLSFEVRIALTNIVGYADIVAASSAQLPPELRDAALTIVQSSQHLIRMVDSIRLLGNLDESNVEVVLVPVNMSDLFTRASTRLARIALERNLTIRLENTMSHQWYMTDARGVGHIIDNLTEIMARHTENGGSILVDVTTASVPASSITSAADAGKTCLQIRVLQTSNPIHVPATPANAHAMSRAHGDGLTASLEQLLSFGQASPHTLTGAAHNTQLSTDQIMMGVAKKIAALVSGTIRACPATAGSSATGLVLELLVQPVTPPSDGGADGGSLQTSSHNLTQSPKPALANRSPPGQRIDAARVATIVEGEVAAYSAYTAAVANPPSGAYSQAPPTPQSPLLTSPTTPGGGANAYQSVTGATTAAMAAPVLDQAQAPVQPQQQQAQQPSGGLPHSAAAVQSLQQVAADPAPLPTTASTTDESAGAQGELWICPPDEVLVPPRAPAERLILVVEDDTINQRIIRALLKKLGYTQITFASDGADALFHYNDLRREGRYFDAILLDQTLPTLSGDDMCMRIRKQDRTQVIISCSANTQLTTDQELCRALGYDEAVTKPLYLDTLKEVLLRWTVAGDARRVRHMKRRLKREALTAGKLVTPASFAAGAVAAVAAAANAAAANGGAPTAAADQQQQSATGAGAAPPTNT
ncbi:hypothetical protein H9P43_002473 [Blastocladiella emersonii ATCC 22665]|nr:hypothetical protein H9P43_002473 [Blastocladiella emersonii ATCC 22665]